MFATSGGMDVPGGGTIEMDELAETTLLLSRTSPLSVATTWNHELAANQCSVHALRLTVPLTVRMPPIGAAGGMVLSEALAARPINSSRVLVPEVGLLMLAQETRVEARNHTRL
jgi:hypothetical protein